MNKKLNGKDGSVFFYKDGKKLKCKKLELSITLQQVRNIIRMKISDYFTKNEFPISCDDESYITIQEVINHKNEIYYETLKNIPTKYKEEVRSNDQPEFLNSKRKRNDHKGDEKKTELINSENNNKCFIYALRCENNKYYVGKTKDPNKRIYTHLEGNGSSWTHKYKPIDLVLLKEGDDFEEDKTVKQYMANYGIDNVRGGSYSQETLNVSTLKLIQREIRSAHNLCLKCGSQDHFVEQCTNKENEIASDNCTRCGRNTHNVDKCHAVKNFKGEVITDKKLQKNFN